MKKLERAEKAMRNGFYVKKIVFKLDARNIDVNAKCNDKSKEFCK